MYNEYRQRRLIIYQSKKIQDDLIQMTIDRGLLARSYTTRVCNETRFLQMFVNIRELVISCLPASFYHVNYSITEFQ